MSNDKLSPEPSPGARPAPDHDSHRSLIRSTSILSLGTLSSRILGFLRDIVLARLLGTGLRADAFFVALKIPNLFRDMVGEGATNAAVVPVLAEYHHKEREQFWNFVNIVLTLALMILSLITLAGVLGAPLIVRVIAPGFLADPVKLDLTIRLTKVMFPYLILIGLTSYSMGILYTFRSFLVPAFTPCLLNIAIITSALLASRSMAEPVYGLAVGVLIGGVLQLVFQIPAMTRIGFRWRPPTSLRHPGATKIGRLLVPRMIGSGVYQMTVFIDTFCASLATIVGAGGISAIYYANRIIQFPMGIFSVAMASALLPSLSAMANKKDHEGIKNTLIFFLENIVFVMFPTTIMLLFLSEPIIRVLFERGEFGSYSTGITAWALTCYSIGLFSFGGIKILVTAFHSLQDTKTPVKVAGLCLAINAVLNFILMYPLKVGGIALASAVAGTVDFLVLFGIMNSRLGGLRAGLLAYSVRVAMASLLTGGMLHWCWQNIVIPNEFLKLILLGSAGYVFYGMFSLAFGINQAKRIWNYIKYGS
ncbi:MAG: murein biosynthesis integral membrane protein MurJ [Candidatus Omnitrophica bacterium]|nr:murein biosynthesis integral membrane protein MurJ [Candidatus Omnitrophota bacterium]